MPERSIPRHVPAVGRGRDVALSLSGSALLAAAIPVLFVAQRYQPSVSMPFGDATIDFRLADLAVLVVVVAAAVRARRGGLASLRVGRGIFAAAAGLLAIVLVSLVYPGLRDHPYDWHSHLVSAAKFAWYAPLALAVPLLIRRRDDAARLFKALVLTSGAATTWGALQFLGLVNELQGKRPGQREPSFTGIHDFAALSGATLALGIAGLALGDRRPLAHRWSVAALATGGLGLVLSGAMTGVAGVWLAAGVILLFARLAGNTSLRPALTTLAILVAVTAGAATMRASAIERFAEFIGLREHRPDTRIQSYAHRTLLAYIGAKIFLDHPVTGVGWQGSREEWAFAPHLAEAHRRFPSEPEEAFPSKTRLWGVQNLYVETLADLGLLGFAALAALFGAALAAGIRGATKSEVTLVPLAWLFVVAGVWVGIGLIPGTPIAALTWITLGLVAVRV